MKKESQIKKILFIITKGNLGGAQKYILDISTSLPKEIEPLVATGEGDLLIQKLKELNIKTIELKNSEREINLRKDFETIKEILEILKIEMPDIVHLNSSKIGILGSIAIFIYNLKLKIESKIKRRDAIKINSIFTSHGWAFNEQNRSAISKFIYYLGHYFTVILCDKTIAVSEKTKKDISWLPFINKKIEVIHNGIENFEALEREEVRNIFMVSPQDTVIFSMSEMHPNKGLDVAIKSMAMLPHQILDKIIYVIAGNGEEENELKKIANESGLTEKIKFLGFVDNSKKLLLGADIFLMPSRNENLPFALLEAGIKGLPIIATAVGGIPEIIKDMQNGILVHKNNSKEIAEAIIYLIDHEKNQKQFGKEITKTVKNFFGLNKTIRATLDIYRNL